MFKMTYIYMQVPVSMLTGLSGTSSSSRPWRPASSPPPRPRSRESGASSSASDTSSNIRAMLTAVVVGAAPAPPPAPPPDPSTAPKPPLEASLASEEATGTVGAAWYSGPFLFLLFMYIQIRTHVRTNTQIKFIIYTHMRIVIHKRIPVSIGIGEQTP